MATLPEDDEPLELTEELEPDESEEQQAEPGENPDDEGEEQVSVSFDGEEPEPEPDNSAFRQMRQALREKDRRIAELEKSSVPKPVEIGPKPELWSDDIAGDEELYDQRMEEWREQKTAAARQSESQAEQNRKVNEAWQQDLTAFEQKKDALAFEDRDEAIDGVTSSLDLVQQAVIVKAADDPALFLYALSKSPAKLAELGKIQDPVKMAAAVARMEGAVKVVKGRKAPAPDKPLSGSASMPGNTDKQLEKLEKEADRTGDRTKVIAYNRAQREKAK